MKHMRSKMAKIPRINIFDAVTEAIDRNDYASADRMMEIAIRSMIEDKKNKTFSIDVELKNDMEISLFSVEDIIFM